MVNLTQAQAQLSGAQKEYEAAELALENARKRYEAAIEVAQQACFAAHAQKGA